MKKHSKRYSISKKLEYEQALRKSKRYMDYEKIKAYENQILSKNLSKLLQSSDSPDFASAQVVADTSHAARIRYKNTLSSSTKDILDLGIKHTVSDLLYTLPRVRRAFDSAPASYTSFGQAQGSMSDFVLGSDDSGNHSIAEFNKFDDLSKKEQDAIRRAEEELYRISYSLEELEDKGLLTAQEGKQYRTERMTYEERYRFLYLLRNVDNFMQKAQASKFTFIADTYIERRQGVLVEDFGGKYDKYIREKIKEFLQAESRYMSSIERRGELTDDLRRNIETKLKEFDRKVNKSSKSYTNSSKARAEYENRAEMIIATEVSTAYNFGKLIGFSGMQDLEKKFIWNADWELQFTSQYYEVCEHCKSMDGREFTVRELLVIGTQLDVGAGGFGRSGRRTDFKNPSLPMIPSHPSCACFDANAIVTCRHGNIPISLVKVGDQVKVPTRNQYEKVTQVHKNWYKGNAKKITIDYGAGRREEITCTENHPFWTQEGWKEAIDLRVGDSAYIETAKLGQNLTGTYTELSRAEIGDVVHKGIKHHFRYVKRIGNYVRYSISKCFGRSETGRQKCMYPGTASFDGAISRSAYAKTFKNICTALTQTRGLCQDSISKRSIYGYSQPGAKDKQQSDSPHAERYGLASSFCQSVRQNISHLWGSCKMRVSRGYEAIFQKCMGSQYSPNIQPIRNYMGVRTESFYATQREEVPSRFLSSRAQSLRGSEREVEAILLRESTTVPGDGEFFIDNSRRRVQGFEEDFQGLNSIRVISVEDIEFENYVYNLTVSNVPVYFVNDVLVHNCYWTLQQDDRRFESEDIYEDIPIEEINKLDPQRQIITSTKGNLAMQLAGAGLVVGGAFLLSRSNMWNTFAAALANRNPIPFKQIGDVMDDTLQYVADEFSDEVGVAVSNTVRDVVNSPPQLPITKVRAVSLV